MPPGKWSEYDIVSPSIRIIPGFEESTFLQYGIVAAPVADRGACRLAVNRGTTECELEVCLHPFNSVHTCI